MKIERVWQMPNHQTFEIPKISKLIDDEIDKNKALDPFPFPYQKDALKFLKETPDNSFNFGLYDPPYSQRQLREMYDSLGLHYEMNSSYWKKIEEQWTRIIRVGGIVIRFGWNSKRMKGFEIIRILLVSHGGQHNDTIVTVQKRIGVIETKVKGE